MITVEQFIQMSHLDDLWRVIPHYNSGPRVIKSKLNSDTIRSCDDIYVVRETPERFFLNKEEAEEYATQLNIIHKLKGT